MSESTQENQKNSNKRLGRGLGSLLGEATGSNSSGSSVFNKAAGAVVGSGASSGSSSATMGSSSGSTISGGAQAAAPAAPIIPPEARVWKIAIDKLRPSAFQPRNHFEKDKLEELAQSIKVSGIIQPIVARKNGSAGYEIIAGERRWRAAQLAGLHEVPVVLKELDDRATLEMAIIENVQREDLNPIEEAEAYQRLAEEFSLTQQQVSEKVGKERATVANAVRLLQLPYEVREMVARKELTAGHAKVLLGLDNAFDQKKWANQVLKENLTVRKLEKLLKKDETEIKNELSADDKSGVRKKLVDGLSEELQKLLGTKVAIDYHEGKGKISINFYTDDQLTSVIDRIREGCQK